MEERNVKRPVWKKAKSVLSGEFIRAKDGSYMKVKGNYPCDENQFVQFWNGMGWTVHKDANVLVKKY